MLVGRTTAGGGHLAFGQLRRLEPARAGGGGDAVGDLLAHLVVIRQIGGQREPGIHRLARLTGLRVGKGEIETGDLVARLHTQRLPERVARGGQHNALAAKHQHFTIPGKDTRRFAAEVDGAVIGIGRTLPVAQARFGAGVEFPHIAVVRIGGELLLKFLRRRPEIAMPGGGVWAFRLRRCGGGDDMRRVGQRRRAQLPIQRARPARHEHRQNTGQARAARGTARPAHRGIGHGQQTALDFQPGGGGLPLPQHTARQIGVDLGELVAIDRTVELATGHRRRSGVEQRAQHDGHDQQQQHRTCGKKKAHD